MPAPPVMETLIKRCRSHVVLGIETEETSCVYFLVSHVFPVKDGLWLDGLGGADVSLPEGLSKFHCL